MKKLLLSVSFASLILLSACSETPDYINTTDTNATAEVHYIEHVPNKLYYIPHESSKNDFVLKYNIFVGEHPDLKILQVMPVSNENTYNTDSGYFVFTEEK